MTDLPIGVFDSGVGGLTVLRALRNQLPAEHFVYLGDTARLPYGTKSADTVRRYALKAAGVLVERGIKALVVACNTASAVALESLARAYAPIPVIGVVEPGAIAAAKAAADHASDRVVVLATESCVAGGAYVEALLEVSPTLGITQRACPLLVTLAEEGRRDDEVTRTILADYLPDCVGPHRRAQRQVLLLGCTHFPVFRNALKVHLGSATTIIDSARTTAVVVDQTLQANRLGGTDTAPGTLKLLATDGEQRFCRVGRYFLGSVIDSVEIIDL